MERKERIAVLKEEIKLTHNTTDIHKALQETISDLELLDKASGGVEKKAIPDMSEPLHDEEWLREKGFNEAIDLCNAHWAEKMRGIEHQINLFIKKLSTQNNRYFDLNAQEELARALITYLTKWRKEIKNNDNKRV